MIIVTKKYCFILLFIIFTSNVLSVNANTRTFKLKATSCKMAECYHPRNGFVFKSASKEISFNNDSFILDFNRKNFRWTDNKGSSDNKMYDVQSILSGYTFKTEHHYVRLIATSSNNMILGIIISANDNWYYLEFRCTIN
jgi:hypothetical protein